MNLCEIKVGNNPKDTLLETLKKYQDKRIMIMMSPEVYEQFINRGDVRVCGYADGISDDEVYEVFENDQVAICKRYGTAVFGFICGVYILKEFSSDIFKYTDRYDDEALEECVYLTNLTQKVTKDDPFVLIEASKLSLEDDFMKYEPQTDNQRRFKEELTSAIKSGVMDFYRPIYDPSIDENGNIVFVAGKRPDVGHSYNWWVEAAKKYVSNRKIRLGTKNEYVAFLGVLIKKLIASGWSVADAWKAVCDDSKMLGHYWNSEDAKHSFEGTGSREVCGFFDLANTYKTLAWDDEAGGFWLASGSCSNDGNLYPLADLGLVYNQDCGIGSSVGWYVL